MDFKQIIKGTIELIKSISNKEEVYCLHFIKEDDNKWYIDFPDWPFDHHNLMMMAGADDLCEAFSHNGKHATVEVEVEHDGKGIEATRMYYSITGGAYYHCKANALKDRGYKFWLCPVTLFVLGKYPKYMYIRGLK